MTCLQLQQAENCFRLNYPRVFVDSNTPFLSQLWRTHLQVSAHKYARWSAQFLRHVVKAFMVKTLCQIWYKFVNNF